MTAAAPLVHPPPASGADALYDANLTFHLLIKPDNLTCYQHHSEGKLRTVGLGEATRVSCHFVVRNRSHRVGESLTNEEVPAAVVNAVRPEGNSANIAGTNRPHPVFHRFCEGERAGQKIGSDMADIGTKSPIAGCSLASAPSES